MVEKITLVFLSNQMKLHGKTRWKLINPLAMECNLQAFFCGLACITNKHIGVWLEQPSESKELSCFTMLVFLNVHKIILSTF